jgi:hypothetical protein
MVRENSCTGVVMVMGSLLFIPLYKWQHRNPSGGAVSSSMAVPGMVIEMITQFV